jgi:protein gp37
MAKQKPDGISWTDYSLNLWWGCSRVHGSPACEDPDDPTKVVCYAERDSIRYGYSDKPGAAQFPIWGDRAARRFFGDRPFNDLLKINKVIELGRRNRVFIMSFGDWAEGRPDQRPKLEKLWTLWPELANIDGLFLTKRPQLIRTLCPMSWNPSMSYEVLDDSPAIYARSRGRIWQGTTAENQHWLDIRWPHLRDATYDDQIAWLSIEPQVGKIVLPQDFLDRGKLAWVVVGGQSGYKPYEFDLAWARSLRDQCKEASVPFHMKQLSGNSKAELKAIPIDLMIREWPQSL